MESLMREADKAAQAYFVLYLHKTLIRQFSGYTVPIPASHLTTLSLTVESFDILSYGTFWIQLISVSN